MASAPAATRAAVSRARPARARRGRRGKPYFCMPARSAWPGRAVSAGPWWRRLDRHLLVPPVGRDHSVLAISMATGEPSVRPCRTPPMMVSSSCSKRMRGPRPKPRRRRQLVADLLDGDRQAGGQALDDDGEGATVGLARGEVAEHVTTIPAGPAATGTGSVGPDRASGPSHQAERHHRAPGRDGVAEGGTGGRGPGPAAGPVPPPSPRGPPATRR